MKRRISSTGIQDDSFSGVSALPLSSIIRFYDDLAGKFRTIRTTDVVWKTIIDAESIKIDWGKFNKKESDLLKRFIAWTFARYDPTTTAGFIKEINFSSVDLQIWIAHLSRPEMAKKKWETDGYRQVSANLVKLLRCITYFFCEMSVCGWNPDDEEYLMGWKWFEPSNRSSVSHVHSYYLTSNEEHKLISYFQKCAENSDTLTLNQARSACLLYMSYQFGVRRIQIASLTRSDIEVIKTPNDTIVHVTFYKAKQLSTKKREPMLRKIKREWACIFEQYMQLDNENNKVRSDRLRHDNLFNLTPIQVTNNISTKSEKLIGRGITPTLFRHVAAQRMADLGMSQLELAEFLGHSVIDTCLVYFENSATQAEVVNRALGLSPIFKKVSEISKHRFLEDEELNDLPEDQQIGGAAHGIILAGIGGCAIGQSLCQLSPAISCYTCPKFLPIHKASIHKAVANDLGKVVSKFEQSGRSDHSNPAYTQLSTTMSNILSIIETIEKPNA